MNSFEGFCEYLTSVYISRNGGHYSKKIAIDMVSRINNVKEILGTRFTKRNILSDAVLLQMIGTIKETKKSPNNPHQYYLYSPYILALKLYRKFLEQQPSHKK